MKASFVSLLASVSLSTVSATYGVDISQLASYSAFSCMKSNGMNFAIPRGWCSYGGADSNVIANV